MLSVAVPLSGEQPSDKSDKQSAATAVSKEEYDEVSSSEKTSDTKPPLVFPESENDQSTSKNETALEILQSNTSTVNKTVVDEVSSIVTHHY